MSDIVSTGRVEASNFIFRIAHRRTLTFIRFSDRFVCSTWIQPFLIFHSVSITSVGSALNIESTSKGMRAFRNRFNGSNSIVAFRNWQRKSFASFRYFIVSDLWKCFYWNFWYFLNFFWTCSCLQTFVSNSTSHNASTFAWSTFAFYHLITDIWMEVVIIW